MLTAAGGHMTVKSTSSMELGSLYRRTEVRTPRLLVYTQEHSVHPWFSHTSL